MQPVGQTGRHEADEPLWESLWELLWQLLWELLWQSLSEPGVVTRRHADPVEVLRRDDAPAQFLWHERLYLVREVLAHWTESGRWWGTAAARSLGDGEPAPAAATVGPLELAPIPSSPKWAQRAWGEPAPDVGAAVGPASVDDRERELWRVEAAAGRSAASGVYDLCFDWSLGRWHLQRVLD